ncbi:hypothetical protein ACSBR2_017266 [Camellia fascicularis]
MVIISSFHTTMLFVFQLLYSLFIISYSMTNSMNLSSSPIIITKKTEDNPLPIQTLFKLPSPIPNWPPGEGFASGTIDLGGLELCQITSFTQIWATHEGGPEGLGATFFEPSSIPKGFFMLGFYGQPNNSPLFGSVVAAKDVIGEALRPPIDYTLVWSSESSKINQDGNAYIWLPIPPDGYKAVGHVITSSPNKPSLDQIRCVRSDFTDVCETDAFIWGEDANGLNFYGLRPTNRGIGALGLSAGTFVAHNGVNNPMPITCLKNVNGNLTSMPSLSQIQALVQGYSPVIYFHPDEQYLPSSVSWFFQNGALLYTKGNESNPVSIEPTGSNLPQGGSNDGAYWLDLPVDQAAKEQVKKGNLQDAGVYLHVKPVLGATFTDIAMWVFCPFNGPSKAKVGIINVSLGKIGEHVGDWEHVTLRISNFNGELKSVYFSQHGAGVWVDAPNLEFQSGNKLVAYAALHSHAMSPKAEVVLQGNGGIGIKMETGKGKMVFDTGSKYLVVGAEYLGSEVVELPWLNYAREWGPKLDYSIDGELKKVEKLIPGFLKAKFEKIIRGLPRELLGEEGPTGPKMKNNWNGDENV